MSRFGVALDFVLRREGGYANNPNDPGGATMQGVTQRVYDQHRAVWGEPLRPVRQIAPDELRKIYEWSYWIPSKAADIDVSHPLTALCHFDCAVNCGVGMAAKLLQRALRVLDDGKIGPVTMQALRAADDRALVGRYLEFRATYYRAIVDHRPRSAEFLPGWLARLRHVARACGVDIHPTYARTDA